MRKIAMLALLIGAFTTSAYAQDNAAMTNWKAKMLANQEVKTEAIPKIAKDYRDVYCPNQTTEARKKACVALYTLVINRLAAEWATLDAQITGADLDQQYRDQVLQETTLADDYNKQIRETQRLLNEANKSFGSTRSSSLER